MRRSAPTASCRILQTHGQTSQTSLSHSVEVNMPLFSGGSDAVKQFLSKANDGQADLENTRVIVFGFFVDYFEIHFIF